MFTKGWYSGVHLSWILHETINVQKSGFPVDTRRINDVYTIIFQQHSNNNDGHDQSQAIFQAGECVDNANIHSPQVWHLISVPYTITCKSMFFEQSLHAWPHQRCWYVGMETRMDTRNWVIEARKEKQVPVKIASFELLSSSILTGIDTHKPVSLFQ